MKMRDPSPIVPPATSNKGSPKTFLSFRSKASNEGTDSSSDNQETPKASVGKTLGSNGVWQDTFRDTSDDNETISSNTSTCSGLEEEFEVDAQSGAGAVFGVPKGHGGSVTPCTSLASVYDNQGFLLLDRDA